MIVEPRAEQWVWLDGEYVSWPRAQMHVSDHHYGVGVFEGVRAYAGESGTVVFRLQDHTARLFRSARILKMEIPERYNPGLLDQVQVELLRRNGFSDAYIRPFIFYGGTQGLSPRARDLSVHVAILTLRWVDEGVRAADRGLVLRTATLVRTHATNMFTRAKANGNYMQSILALKEARAKGADEILFLDAFRCATETSCSNLFMVRDRTVLTPPLESILEGITRETVLTLAERAGLEVVERRLSLDDLYSADEAFVTGTAAELTPVRELDGRTIGAGTRGPVTERLQELYAAHVRGHGDHRHDWLTRV
jgi:branched-chain amino acid aminotransferase